MTPATFAVLLLAALGLARLRRPPPLHTRAGVRRLVIVLLLGGVVAGLSACPPRPQPAPSNPGGKPGGENLTRNP